MDGMAVDVELLALAIAYDEIKALALGVSCPFDESACFAVMAFCGLIIRFVGRLSGLLLLMQS